jgi:hypothetical protein
MRTKNLDKDEDVTVAEPEARTFETVLADAEREELEQLRAERDARVQADKAIADAEKRAAMSVTLNLPPAAGKGIQMGGRMYYHGHSYQVSNDVKWALEEAERRCWAHESSLHESENKGRKQRRAFIGTGE